MLLYWNESTTFRIETPCLQGGLASSSFSIDSIVIVICDKQIAGSTYYSELRTTWQLRDFNSFF